MLKEMGPLASLEEAQAQSRKEGIGELDRELPWR